MKHPTSSKKGLIKAAGVVGGSTFLSRCLGMMRDVVNARQFGTTWQWDAFLYAFMIPNFFRRLVGEGALSSAFIPVYSETLEKQGQEAAFRFANATLTLLAVSLLAFLLIAEVGLSLALEWGNFGNRLTLTCELLKQLFPYLILISLFALGMGILNAHRHFFIPSLAPVLLNIFWIIGVLFIVPLAGVDFSEQLKGLAWVLLAAGALQLASELPMLYRLGFRVRFVWDLTNKGLRQAGRLILPAVLGFAIIQINLLVDMTLAFFIGPGANSSLWYGARLMQFPLGIFGIGMGTALLPMIAKQTAQKDHEASKNTMAFALRTVFLIILPSSVGLIILASPIVELLFQRGEFDAISTARTSAVLIFYCFGLFAYSGQKIMIAGFHAFQDTKTPVKIGAIALLTNLILNLILMGPLKEAGLALATSISGVLHFTLLAVFYCRGAVKIPFGDVLKSFVKILVAAGMMGVVCFFTYSILGGSFSGNHILSMIVRVFGTILLSIFTFLAMCALLRIREFKDAWAWIQKRQSSS